MDAFRIPLSEYQQKYFAALLADEQRVVQQRNTAVTVLLSALHDPTQFATWQIRVDPTEVVCSPPLALVAETA